MTKGSFFAKKEQAEFIQKVYKQTPDLVQDFFNRETGFLQEALAGKKLVLEVGCGFGRSMPAVDPKSHYFGVDIGFTYVAEALRRNNRGNWICGDARNLSFCDSSFDAVFCIQNTLGNMEGIESRVIHEAKRVCAENGSLIFSVYSEDSFEVRRLWYDRLVDAGIFGRVWLDDNPKVARSDTGWSSRCFDQQELIKLLGLKNIQVKKLDSFLYFCTGQPDK
ncbi:MAG: hypothetical protein C5B54_00250 [Acidobacteria bacterium]|nr:MAG: hypothetical protein C5B54_00250 [Acidobacteriota bacterium]